MSQVQQQVNLEPLQEWRIETDTPVSITLTKGSAEIFGSEIPLNKPITFSSSPYTFYSLDIFLIHKVVMYLNHAYLHGMDAHYKSMEHRLLIILQEIRQCIRI